MWDKLQAFFASPYRSGMSALDWFLFVGLILMIMVAWRMILSHIAAEF